MSDEPPAYEYPKDSGEYGIAIEYIRQVMETSIIAYLSEGVELDTTELLAVERCARGMSAKILMALSAADCGIAIQQPRQ